MQFSESPQHWNSSQGWGHGTWQEINGMSWRKLMKTQTNIYKTSQTCYYSPWSMCWQKGDENFLNTDNLKPEICWMQHQWRLQRNGEAVSHQGVYIASIELGIRYCGEWNCLYHHLCFFGLLQVERFIEKKNVWVADQNIRTIHVLAAHFTQYLSSYVFHTDLREKA